MSSPTTIELQGPRTKICTTIGCYHPVCLAVKRKEKENLVKQIKHDIDENIMQIFCQDEISVEVKEQIIVSLKSVRDRISQL